MRKRTSYIALAVNHVTSNILEKLSSSFPLVNINMNMPSDTRRAQHLINNNKHLIDWEKEHFGTLNHIGENGRSKKHFL